MNGSKKSTITTRKLTKEQEIEFLKSIQNIKPLEKDEIISILKDYSDIPTLEIWEKLIEIQSKYLIKNEPLDNFFISQQEYVKEAFEFFDGYIVSFNQNDLVIDFILKIRRFYTQNLEESEIDPKFAKSQTELTDLNPNNYEIQKIEYNNDIVSFQEVYANTVMDIRTKINTTIYEDLFISEYKTRLLYCFDMPISSVQERTAEDMYYFLVSALIYLPIFGTKTPFERYSNKVFGQKRVNKDREIYLRSVEESITSFFVITSVDNDAGIVWIRDVFGDGRLFPLIDISMTSLSTPEDLLFEIGFLTIIPAFHTTKGATVFIHNGGSLMCVMPLEYLELRIQKLQNFVDQENSEAGEVLDSIIKCFVTFFDKIITTDFEPAKARLIKNKFIGDIETAKMLYVAVKLRQMVIKDNGGKLLKYTNR